MLLNSTEVIKFTENVTKTTASIINFWPLMLDLDNKSSSTKQREPNCHLTCVPCDSGSCWFRNFLLSFMMSLHTCACATFCADFNEENLYFYQPTFNTLNDSDDVKFHFHSSEEVTFSSETFLNEIENKFSTGNLTAFPSINPLKFLHSEITWWINVCWYNHVEISMRHKLIWSFQREHYIENQSMHSTQQ